MKSSVPVSTSGDAGAHRPLGGTASVALLAALVVAFFAASSAPTPLYGVYRDSWGFSPAWLTVVFGVYALSLLSALLVTGALSEHLGRRPVIVAAVALEAVAMAVFASAGSVWMLLCARVIQGVATGVASSALGAALIDHAPRRGAWINSVAPGLGMGAGALGSGALVQFAPAPMRLVFLLLLAVFAVLGFCALRLRETASLRPGALASLLPRVRVPPHARRALWLAAPVEIAVWALGGLYLSLGPSLARLVTGSQTPLIGGLLVATLTVCGTIATLVLGGQAAAATMRIGAVALAAGTALTLGGLHAASTALFFVGTAVAGVGFGAGFLGALRTVLAPAAPHERAGLVAAFYVMSYLANSLPAMAAGVAVGHVGLVAAADGYAAVVIALALAALALGLRRPRP